MNPGLGLALTVARRREVRPRAAPLDGFAAALLTAYGLRRLRANYAGPLVRLRRASDNAQQDFAAGPGGWLSGAAVLAWAGASSAYVATWYDQSSHGFHATQATAANQPRLVNAGAVDAAPNGRPWLVLDGAASLVTAASASLPKADEPSTALVVARASNVETANNRRTALLWGNNAIDQNRLIVCDYAPTSRPAARVHDRLSAEAAVNWNDGIRSIAARHFTPVSGQTTLTVSADGVASTRTYAGSLATASPTSLHLGGRTASWTAPWTGTMAEVALFASALTDPQIAALRAEHRSAWATP